MEAAIKINPVYITASFTHQRHPSGKIRQKVWDYIEAKNLTNFPRPVHNRIPNFKTDIDAALKKVEDMEKENAKVMLQNKRLAEPLLTAREEVVELQKQMAHYRKDKAKRGDI